MGCGGSRLSPGGEVVPAKLRPLLRHRIVELRRRGNVDSLKGPNLSKKQLLKDVDNSPPNSLHDDDSKSVSSPEENDYKLVPSSKESVSSPKAPEETSVPKFINKTSIVAKEHEQDKEEREEKVIEDVSTAVEEVEEVLEGDEEEEGRLSNEEDRHVCPGSPSFRVYYIESMANKDDDSNDDSTKEELQSGDSGESIEAVNSNEGSVTKTKKKAKKGRRFSKVIPKGGQAAVKTLFNVRSCYHPACSSHDKTRLLAEKAAA